VKQVTVIAVCVLVCVACGASSHARQGISYVDRIDNPWFPLTPGSVFVYRGVKNGESARDVVTVTDKTTVIDGVRCTAVDDRLYLRGHLFERTTDWYAQDVKGTVWYFGEATAELDESGHVTSNEGSWRAGVDGARAGIVMPAKPRVGRSFRQEYYEGRAEDSFRILSSSASVRVPYTSSTQALLTKEWTPLEPDVVDHKLYVRGVGLVEEETVKGGEERAVLIAVRRR
jgi:hypothetical protein